MLQALWEFLRTLIPARASPEGMVNNAEVRRGRGDDNPPVLLLESSEAADTRSAFAAVERGDLRGLKELVPAVVGVRAKSVFQSEMLHVACQKGRPDIVAYLLEHGADPDALDYGGMRRTPLHWACWCAAGRASPGNPLRCVEILMAAGPGPRTWGPGPSWGALNSKACGSRVSTSAATCSDDPSSLAGEVHGPTMALALQGTWSRKNHASFPESFKGASQLLLLVAKRLGHVVDDHLVDKLLSLMAFPLSSWVPGE